MRIYTQHGETTAAATGVHISASFHRRPTKQKSQTNKTTTTTTTRERERERKISCIRSWIPVIYHLIIYYKDLSATEQTTVSSSSGLVFLQVFRVCCFLSGYIASLSQQYTLAETDIIAYSAPTIIISQSALPSFKIFWIQPTYIPSENQIQWKNERCRCGGRSLSHKNF